MFIRFAPKLNSPSLPLTALDAGTETIRQTETYSWPFYQLVCCYQGEGTVVIEGQVIPLKPGSLFLMKPGTVHEYVFQGKGYGLSWVSFTGRLAGDLMEHYGIEPSYTSVTDASHPGIHLDIMSILEEVENPFVIDRVSVILYRLLISFFIQYQTDSTAANISDGMNLHLQRAIDWMKTNISSPADVSLIARELGLSRQHLTRLFRKKFGMSTIEFFTKLKMLQAQKDLIQLPGSTVKDIAESLGFVNSSHFARVFRQHAHHTPSSFRALYPLGRE